MEKKLSIIIPAYNAEKFIDACINSCLIPRSNDIEVIVIDDGSTDGTYNRVSLFAETHKQEHKGVSSARNHGLDLARGKYVWFVDADDLINPDGLKHVLSYCDGKENIVRFNHYRYYKAKDKLMRRFEQPPYWVWFHERQFLWEVVWDRIYNRQFLIDNKLRFNEKLNFGEDQIFNLEALHANKGYKQDGHFVYVKTWNNPESITHKLDIKLRQQNINILRELKKKYKDDKEMVSEIDFQIFKLLQLPSFKECK